MHNEFMLVKTSLHSEKYAALAQGGFFLPVCLSFIHL
jgi:hypothetical protein